MSASPEQVSIPPSPDVNRPWWDRFGLATDRLLNVLLLNGDDTWTVSLHSAVAQREGKRWGCVFCAILGVLVQRDHCDITLNPNLQETTGAALKAGVLMAVVIGLMGAGLYFLIEAFP